MLSGGVSTVLVLALRYSCSFEAQNLASLLFVVAILGAYALTTLCWSMVPYGGGLICPPAGVPLPLDAFLAPAAAAD